MNLTIRRAAVTDEDGIWAIFHEVVQQGDTYTYDPDISREEAIALWFAPLNQTFVACLGDEIVGTYIIKPNQPGLGSHVANAGYMVRGDKRGLGIGRALCEHSLEAARQSGFEAMQFNIVISTNTGAVKLWQSLGFAIVGTLPKVYRHKEFGLVDAYVMHRFLDPNVR
jgi:L-amino acid N-acyltransferase YncA